MKMPHASGSWYVPYRVRMREIFIDYWSPLVDLSEPDPWGRHLRWLPMILVKIGDIPVSLPRICAALRMQCTFACESYQSVVALPMSLWSSSGCGGKTVELLISRNLCPRSLPQATEVAVFRTCGPLSQPPSDPEGSLQTILSDLERFPVCL